MATIQDRSFSPNYHGLKNQLSVAGVLTAFCLTGYELMRRKRRGRGLNSGHEIGQDVGSVETWEFGYLYQGRCWAKKPSPPLPKWPLEWIKQALALPETSLPDLIGIDATLYIRFLKGCRLFMLLHTCTTFPILFTIHLVFSPDTIASDSMYKASISSLVQSGKGLRLLFVHVILAYYIAITWILNLLWIARGTFRYRAKAIENLAEDFSQTDSMFHVPEGKENLALRLRTVMVTNVPAHLRSEKALKEYFEYYMSRPFSRPPIAPGFIPKIMAFLLNRAASSSAVRRFKAIGEDTATENLTADQDKASPAIVDRIVIARKMTELASLLERRLEVLKKLEYSHVRLARKALLATRQRIDDPSPDTKNLLTRITSLKSTTAKPDEEAVDVEAMAQEKKVTDALASFVAEFHVPSPKPIRRNISRFRHFNDNLNSLSTCTTDSPTLPTASQPGVNENYTVWEALYDLPRAALDAYQPLIRLNKLFRGQTVPAIDYYTAKLGLLTALINENRGRALEAYPPSSTAFVTFEKIEDARRAAKFLQVHPRNPLECSVMPAPDVADLDWARVMKTAFTGEFLKDWVVDLGVWTFTCSWIIPVSLLIGLVNIQNLAVVIPGLQRFFDRHPKDKEAISSLLPTILVSLLTILIPMILLLIAKKAHTIITFSKLHDTIMVRYWKFLVCNLLIFFCVGVVALESFLASFKSSVNFFPLLASTFPVAGPFYVGWLILQTSIHGFLELGLYGLPLILYPSTRRSKTLRQRAAGIRPRTFNFYYWLPNHVLVMTIVACFALLNPLVIPFAFVYFSVESVIVKHQLIHVYAKTYENNGQLILIRIMRYSLDALLLAHVIFLAFLLVLKETSEAAVTGILLGLTFITKLLLTRLCRAKFAETDRTEDFVYSKLNGEMAPPDVTEDSGGGEPETDQPGNDTLADFLPYGTTKFWTWKSLRRIPFKYTSVPQKRAVKRPANPFGPNALLHQPRTPPEHPELGNNGQNSRAPRLDYVTASVECRTFADAIAPPLQTVNSPPRHTSRDSPQPIVIPHVRHDTWDDSPRLDRPYENPYYVAPIENFLWLPRNPFGVLDLDDSVDLHQALTSEVGAGKLGQWMDEAGEPFKSQPDPLVETPDSLPPPDVTEQDSRSSFPFIPSRRPSGNEGISMSSVLSARANRTEHEVEVDHTIRPPSILRTASHYSDSESRRYTAPRRRRSSAFSISKPLMTGSEQAASGVFAPIYQVDTARSQQRSRSKIYDPVREPDVQAQGAFLDSTLSISLSQREQRQKSTGSAIPVREAVVGEIIVEEQVEAMERIWREEEEQRRAEKPSWWNGWLWHKNQAKPSQEEEKQ
ncbi:hypothetical protein BU17DRAFT_50176 [Hysterangium stoloniferum]|nr:hypothetical protein BU17DRAFT_50176 [Hysterangium stoloniferum]